MQGLPGEKDRSYLNTNSHQAAEVVTTKLMEKPQQIPGKVSNISVQRSDASGTTKMLWRSRAWMRNPQTTWGHMALMT